MREKRLSENTEWSGQSESRVCEEPRKETDYVKDRPSATSDMVPRPRPGDTFNDPLILVPGPGRSADSVRAQPQCSYFFLTKSSPVMCFYSYVVWAASAPGASPDVHAQAHHQARRAGTPAVTRCPDAVGQPTTACGSLVAVEAAGSPRNRLGV